MTETSLLRRTADHALGYLDSLDSRAISPTATPAELRAVLGRPLPEAGVSPEKVIDDLVRDVAGGLLGSASGRFFGWVIGGTLPAALAADWLTSAWDQNAALYSTGPAEAVIEEICGKWLKELLGLPASASFALVSGCQMAHATCLAAARNFLLTKHDWDVERKGLSGAPQIRVLSSQRHGSFERTIRLLGLGCDSLIDLHVDDSGYLQADTLSEALVDRTDKPTIVLLQAGDIDTGIYDSFLELIPLANEHHAWVHVDGAFGLWAAVSPKYRHLLEGVEQADSWAIDGHKWLNVPYDCGYAFVAHPEPHRNSMSHHASYLTHADEARDQMDWNPEWSRRGRGFATYAAIRQLGRNGIAEIVDRTCRHAHTLATRLGALEGAELVWEPQINQGLVRFLDPNPNVTDADHDRCTNKVIAATLKKGEALFSGTTWHGKRCMRVSVCNWRTNDNDVDRAVESVRAALAEG
ncbi:MAG: pyridoxal phosphate-dependent decarboxylase family protein [Acidiferrobacterales bacterium]